MDSRFPARTVAAASLPATFTCVTFAPRRAAAITGLSVPTDLAQSVVRVSALTRVTNCARVCVVISEQAFFPSPFAKAVR